MAALTVAFLRRVPVDDAWRQRVPERSVLEQELAEVRASGWMHGVLEAGCGFVG